MNGLKLQLKLQDGKMSFVSPQSKVPHLHDSPVMAHQDSCFSQRSEMGQKSLQTAVAIQLSINLFIFVTTMDHGKPE